MIKLVRSLRRIKPGDRRKIIRISYLACEGRWSFYRQISQDLEINILWQICAFFPDCFPLRHVAGLDTKYYQMQLSATTLEYMSEGTVCVRVVLSGQQEEASFMDIALTGEADLQKLVLLLTFVLGKSLTCSLGDVSSLFNFYSVAPHLRRSRLFDWGGCLFDFSLTIASFEFDREDSCVIKCNRSFLSLHRIECMSLFFFSFLSTTSSLSFVIYITPFSLLFCFLYFLLLPSVLYLCFLHSIEASVSPLSCVFAVILV